MDLLELRKVDEQAWPRLAERLNSSTAYISQLAHGHRRPSLKFAKRLINEDSRLTMQGLRPDMYEAISEVSHA